MNVFRRTTTSSVQARCQRKGVIHTERLTRHFVSKKETVEAVKGVDIDVAAGELVAFLGPERGRKVHHIADADHAAATNLGHCLGGGSEHHQGAGRGALQDRLHRAG